MRIIKYIFLLLLLSLVALSIFIATQKGDFQVERSKIINSPKASVYNYVNDFRNWSDFASWTNNNTDIQTNFSQNSIGKGAYYSWESNDGKGKIHTIAVKENDSIYQTSDFDGNISKVSWRFKDTIGGTKVSWTTKGKMSFFSKIYSALNGGADKVIGAIFEKSLVNLDKALDYEINTFSTIENGLVQKPVMNYIGQSFTSEIAKIHKNFKIVIPKLTTFCEKNNMVITGKPFIIYHSYDTTNGLARVTIGLGIRDAIYLSSGSDLVANKLEAFEGAKTTLTGDYSHLTTAYKKSLNYLNKNKITPNPIFSFLEIYTTGKNEVKSPSKWVTEVFIPITPKIIPQLQSINTIPQTNTSTEITNPKTEEESEF